MCIRDRVIRRLKQEGTTVLLVEQNAAFAVKVADYAHVMSKGVIVHSAEAQALWADEEIKSQYLGVPKAGQAYKAGPVPDPPHDQ